jgi:hypothetical protein
MTSFCSDAVIDLFPEGVRSSFLAVHKTSDGGGIAKNLLGNPLLKYRPNIWSAF